MIKRTDFLKVIVLGLAIISSCERKSEAADESMALSDSVTTDAIIPSSAAEENGSDTLRKFIRTAEIKFKVKNVVTATYRIEKITSDFGGFVTFTNLSSAIDHTDVDKISADSSLQSTYYTSVNNIILRVPNTRLDTVLLSMSELVDYLDYRIIKADDIGLQIVSNNLEIQRLSKHERRLRGMINDRGKKLRETGIAEESLLTKKEISDNANISNLSLMDQVNYSTINLSIYQKQEVKRELIANEKNIEFYEPHFGLKLMDSIKSGWDILEVCILYLVKIWGLLVFLAFAFFFYKKLRPRVK